MGGKTLLGQVISFLGEDEIIINGVGKPKRVKLGPEVIEWLRTSYPARRLVEELVTHYKFRARLSNPGSFRSLILLLYARSHGIPPYKLARAHGIAHEQLYRMERGLKKDKLYEMAMNLLEAEGGRARASKPGPKT